MNTRVHTLAHAQALKSAALQVVTLGACLGEEMHFSFFFIYFNIVVLLL